MGFVSSEDKSGLLAQAANVTKCLLNNEETQWTGEWAQRPVTGADIGADIGPVTGAVNEADRVLPSDCSSPKAQDLT